MLRFLTRMIVEPFAFAASFFRIAWTAGAGLAIVATVLCIVAFVISSAMVVR